MKTLQKNTFVILDDWHSPSVLAEEKEGGEVFFIPCGIKCEFLYYEDSITMKTAVCEHKEKYGIFIVNATMLQHLPMTEQEKEE